MLQKLVSHVDGDVEIRIQVTPAALTNSTHLYFASILPLL